MSHAAQTEAESVRHPWWLGPAAWLGAGLVRVLGATWRIERFGVVERERELAGESRCLFAFWHARLLPLVYTHRARGIAVLVSQHRDGEVIAQIIEHLGFETARGSSTRGGTRGLRELLRWARRGHLLAITPDGPRGPAEQVKEGLVHTASRTGLPVIVIATAASSSWVFRSWDRFRVPRPFARVVIEYSEALAVPRELDASATEVQRVRLEREMQTVQRRASERAGER
ncbi:MAG: lysophospholipid acyltransferase family protein [Candidatus Eisenbacteria bacterium]|uniref:Lysophospholipid acyltransferase family protein n=1 Tax=Eiseniibacteriota bacterium TaxID=2212470 RepID=A0A849SJV3_UNCEI|nr:lysophospholipid acyltransferase family protein [Candidatus Eisenbacteria bacterium]